MSTLNPQYQRQIPSKLLQKASQYTKNLKHYHQLPKNMSKSMVVHQQAEQQKNNIQYSVQQAQFQLSLFRLKEQIDEAERRKFQTKIHQTRQKVIKNGQELEKKRKKEFEEHQKHLKKIYEKWDEIQKRKRLNEKEQAYKLRKQLLQFYKKEEQKKKAAQFKQISVSTCYQNAVNRINNIHKKNEQFSIKSQIQLNNSLNKNNHLDQIISHRKRAISSINQNKEKVYNENLTIFHQRENKFIQKYGQNEDGSIAAFYHIQQDLNKTKKRLGQFFKKRVEKWQTQKKRVDEAKAQIPDKCKNILQKTTNASFRHTVSSFRSTAVEWNKKVRENKSAIKQYDELKKDDIMSIHLDLRLKNDSSYKINEKLSSLRLQAKKTAKEYL